MLFPILFATLFSAGLSDNIVDVDLDQAGLMARHLRKDAYALLTRLLRTDTPEELQSVIDTADPVDLREVLWSRYARSLIAGHEAQPHMISSYEHFRAAWEKTRATSKRLALAKKNPEMFSRLHTEDPDSTASVISRLPKWLQVKIGTRPAPEPKKERSREEKRVWMRENFSDAARVWLPRLTGVMSESAFNDTLKATPNEVRRELMGNSWSRRVIVNHASFLRRSADSQARRSKDVRRLLPPGTPKSKGIH